MEMRIWNKIKQYLPATKKEIGQMIDMLMDICDALETTDKQHSNIERRIMSQLQQSTEQQESNEDTSSHVEFG